jgi:cellulose synthase/poly-beta-1,6-N-acetylglucosamine synthase-like glycosyltransferase/peptidoglycan/xylan/chitin deacetylase (PgdA/CDA1 family)/spore germination protein YaaH
MIVMLYLVFLLPPSAHAAFPTDGADARQSPAAEPPRMTPQFNPSGHIGDSSTPVVFGFYVNWDPTARISFLQHAGDLTHFAPEWLRLDENGGIVDTRIPEDKTVIEPTARAYGLPILPVISSYVPLSPDSDQGNWSASALHRVLGDAQSRANVIARLKQFVVAQQWQGICVDFEQVAPADRDNMTQFMRDLYGAFHAAGLLVTQEISLDDPSLDLAHLEPWSDLFLPVLYQEHSVNDGPASIAGIPWTRQQFADVFARLPANKVVPIFANYAIDWLNGGVTMQSYQSAISQVNELYDLSGGAGPIAALDPQSLNVFYHYLDDNRGAHTVWLLDAMTTYNQWTLASAHRPRGAALWHLGGEDPSVWSVIGRREIARSAGSSTTIDELQQISYGPLPWVTYTGDGEMLELVKTPANGHRTIVHDPRTGLITAGSYQDYPSEYTIHRYGQRPKQIVLSFDDGPDPKYTPQILDILKREGVKAVFFVIGEEAQRYPDLVQRMWDEGHEVGNHTFTHPRPDMVSDMRMQLEVTATQRVIESITGHRTTLLRPPYEIGSDPRTPEELHPTLLAASWNYIVVTDRIDTNDWRPTTQEPNGTTQPRTSADIVTDAWAERDMGNIMLLHDGGGNREATIQALPQIIEKFKAAGYQFTSLSDLSGIPRDQLFPPVSGSEQVMVVVNWLILKLGSLLMPALSFLFVLSIVLGASRQVLIMVLAMIQRQRERRRERAFDPSYQPLVSVVIAAYNEEKVIARTVQTILDSAYPRLEIIVVDDGSKDQTTDVVMNAFAGNRRVQCHRKPNGGKASALNHGLAHAHGEIIIGLDADTLFAPDTIGYLVRHFSDPQVGAVAGNVKVGNVNNMLTKWQSLEYITSQNFDRRAYDLMNCITVVPGAVGAWRAIAIAAVGGYTHDTLAEDTDLTWKIRRAGWHIRNESRALAFTEAPERFANLVRQRYRWAFGILQSLWKHRGAIGHHGAFGWFALPSLWLYSIVFQIIAPVMDVMIIISLASGNATLVLTYAALMLGLELVGALLAIVMDSGHAWRLLPWLLIQRFVYRQIMYYVILKSLHSAIIGHAVGWNKFERTGTAQVAQLLPTGDQA